MVALHDTGDLVRSLVRVPGSGSDMAAGSKCLDLSRASSLAASVHVPQTLPPTLDAPRIVPQPQSLKNNKLEGQVGVAAGILNRKHQSSLEASEPENGVGGRTPAPKKARVVYMTPEQVLSHADRLVPVATPVGPVLFLPLQPRTSNSPPLALTEASVSQLVQERNNLRQENLVLQQRIILFQQLFKDRKRLRSVVKRLGVNIQ